MLTFDLFTLLIRLNGGLHLSPGQTARDSR